jgi:hypothetical protein
MLSDDNPLLMIQAKNRKPSILLSGKAIPLSGILRRATKGSLAVRKAKPGAVSRAGRNNSVSISK